MEKKFLIANKIEDILSDENQIEREDVKIIKGGGDENIFNALCLIQEIKFNIQEKNKKDELEKNIAKLKAEVEKIFYFNTSGIEKLIEELESLI